MFVRFGIRWVMLLVVWLVILLGERLLRIIIRELCWSCFER